MNDKTAYLLEEGKELTLDFSKLFKVSKLCNNVIPVAVQDIETKEIVLIAYTNEVAFKHTLKTRIATFWSTSKNELWIKGKGICHTFNKAGISRNCYYRLLNIESLELENLDP